MNGSRTVRGYIMSKGHVSYKYVMKTNNKNLN